MSSHLRRTLLCASLGMFLCVSAHAQEVRRISLKECVETALRANPDIASARYEQDAAEAALLSARGNYGPRVNVNAGIQVWNKDLPLDFGDTFTPLITWMMQTFARNPGPPAAFNSGPPLVARGQVTWSAGATLVQPLAALWTVDEGYKLRAIGVDLAEIKKETVRRDTAYQVVEAYYRVLQAKRLEEVAEKSVEQVESQVKRAEAFYRLGTVGKNDLLRAQLGLAAAKQKRIQAGGLVTLAQGRLAFLVGLPVNTVLEPTTVPAEAPPRTVLTADRSEQMAVSRRIELTQIDASIRLARGSVSLSKSKMMPQLNAMANYTHSEGQLFAEKDAFFVGGTFSWDIWENGATYYGISEAKARLAQAEAMRAKVEDGLRLEARSAFVNATTAAEMLAVAESAVVQAEENYRIESKRYEAANNTSFDVLDAETQLTNARGQYQAALYDYIIAQSSLARAVGDPPGEPGTSAK